MSIYLIRHGQSTANAARQQFGAGVYHEDKFLDAPLTERGMNQARAASKYFSSSREAFQ